MASSNVTVVEIGIPGPPGAGVTSAEKASFVLDTGDTLTGELEFHVDGSVLDIRKADGTTTKLSVNTTNATYWLLALLNGLLMRGYSDGGSTQTWAFSSAGALELASTLTTTRVIGDTSIWPIVIDGGGSAITTGVKLDLIVPYNALITGWDIVADQSGSIVVDIWQDTYSNYPPTVADTITTGEKPTLSSAVKNQDTSLNSGSGWAVTQGRYLRFNVDSASTVQRVMIGLKVTRT